MLKNHRLARAISDVGLVEFRRQLTYKAAWHGVKVRVANRFYPSSKTCSACGAVKPELLLSERVYRCDDCGLEMDRDWHAAVNLSRLASPYSEGLPTVSSTGRTRLSALSLANACGEDVRPVFAQAALLKQEPDTNYL